MTAMSDAEVAIAAAEAGAAVLARVRRDVATMEEDRNVSDQIVAVDGLLAELVAAAEAAVGALD